LQIVKLGLLPAIAESVRWNAHYGTLIFDGVASLVERRISPKSLQGPISIARMSTQAAREGTFSFLELMAIVSLNLAILNLMPIPILDGGTLLMLVLEMIMQREVSARVKETAFKLGFVFLMILVVFVIYNDITHLFTHT
jgi:regulator of sigma E protease